MNSATSRPRSPISATTETSAAVPRAIIDISDDLPTPEPAKIPSRWPFPHGMRPSSTRTPSGSCAATMPRRSGCGGVPGDRHVGPRDRRAPRPWADRSRRAPGPRARVPRATGNGPPMASTRVPARRPAVSPSARHTTRSSRRATTSAGDPLAHRAAGAARPRWRRGSRPPRSTCPPSVSPGRSAGDATRPAPARPARQAARSSLASGSAGPRRTCRTRSRADPSCPSRMALPISATAPPGSTDGSATTLSTRPRSSASSVSTSSGVQPDGGGLQALVEGQHPGDGVAARGGGQHQLPTQERLEQGKGQLGGGRFDLRAHGAFGSPRLPPTCEERRAAPPPPAATLPSACPRPRQRRAARPSAYPSSYPRRTAAAASASIASSSTFLLR